MAKVILVEPIHESGQKILRAAGLEPVVSPSTDTQTLVMQMDDDVFGIIVRTSKLEGSVLAAGKGLKIIGRHGIGYNNIDLATAEQQNVLICNVPDANSYSVAEHVLGAILLLSRKLVQGDAALRGGKMNQQGASLPGLVKKLNLGGNELPKQVLGIVGLGKIGMQVAHMAKTFFGMRVIGYDPYQKASDVPFEKVDELMELFNKADIVSLHTPATAQTENMVNASVLANMKPTAYLINAARGELIDELALYGALTSGQIAGAVLDVFREEPPSLDNPLFSAPNLLVTPHVAGATEEAVERLAIGAAQAVADFYNGKRPANIVNPKVWEQIQKT